MSHFEPDVKIGSNVRGGASGGGPREKVVRTAAERNAAAREGNLTAVAKQYKGTVCAQPTTPAPRPSTYNSRTGLRGRPTYDQS
jgi:hypothetical protein